MVWIVNGKCGKYIPKDEIEDYDEVVKVEGKYFAVLCNIENINKEVLKNANTNRNAKQD